MNQENVEGQNSVQSESGQVTGEMEKNRDDAVDAARHAQEDAIRAVRQTLGEIHDPASVTALQQGIEYQENFKALVARVNELAGELESLVAAQTRYLSQLAEQDKDVNQPMS